MEPVPAPKVSQKACLAPGAFMQIGSPVSSGGHQALSILDLHAGDTTNWSDMDLLDLQGYAGDDFIDVGGVNAEDFWTSCMKPDPGPSFQQFGGPGNGS
ncbi:hypothetical protein SGCOL_011232 [Colletotrichum sp. CLE4]